MKKALLILLTTGTTFFALAQPAVIPNDCNEAVPGCTTPSFGIVPPNAGSNNFDFGTGTVSNPSTNPGGVGNAGCLLSGETSSTFITITVVSSGTLEWSIQGPNGGCFDWIMWPYTFGSTATNSPTCAQLQNATLPPVACNWNGNCQGYTGMNAPGNMPAGGNQLNFENALNVTAGQNFLLCLSNYSGTQQNVNLNFFGSAGVACGVSAADQTICLGSSTNVTINTPGLLNPTFNWLVTTGVSNTTGGTNVMVTPTVTTTYQVEVSQAASSTSSAFIDTAVFTITVVPPPNPSAGPDQSVCLGDPIHLSGTVTVASNSHSWQSIVPPGLSPPATASFSPNFQSLTPTVTVNQPGVYKFIHREISTVCGTRRDTVLVTVTDLQITATPTSPSCEDYADGQIAITSAGANQFSFDNGVTWQPTPVQGGFTAGMYTVCAMNASGCQKCTDVTIIDPVPVVVSVSNDTLICENGTASLVASATGGTSYVYHWDHTTSLLANQDVNPAANTTYTVIAENQSGCQSLPASIAVTIREPLNVVISPDQNVCPGYPGSITATATGGIGSPYTFTWSTGDVQSGPSSTITQSPTATTTYTVTVEDACESTPFVISTQIIAYPLPVPQIAVDEPIKCEPAVYTLTNMTDPNMSAGTYWRISDGQDFLNMNEIQPEALYAGSYDVTLVVVSPEGCIDSTTFYDYLTVRPKPDADFKWSPDPVTMFSTEVLLSNYSFGADTYQWFIDSGSPSQSTSEHVVTVFPDGVTGYYPVMLIATSDLGCVDTVTKIVPVMPEILLYAPNAFTPDGDEYNQVWKVYMEGVDEFAFELRMYNRWGEIVWESHDINAEWDGTYQGKIMPAGTYSWTINAKDKLSDKKMTWNGKVVIIR
jgi:gliding motility-associated-like protein